MSQDRQLEGLNAIMEFLRLPADFRRQRLVRWIERDGLPARRVGTRYYADPLELRAWWEARRAIDAQAA